MTPHLLLVTLGPVQEFIAQARRTRDLWYGSHLLSELGRAAARALTEADAQLVFPALHRGHPELAQCLAPLRPTGAPPLNVANKLLAELPAEIDPGALARTVRTAVAACWREEIAAAARRRCAELMAEGVDAVWDQQIESFVEFTAAWAPLRDYESARREVERAVAGRKRLHDFAPWTHLRGGVAKSSLDGARETVLRPKEERPESLVTRYRIAKGEELDAIGLVKRCGGEPDQFVPIVNIALATWTELASREAGPELGRLRQRCKEDGISRVERGDLPCACPFPFDASVLLPGRWRSVFEELYLSGDPGAWGRAHVLPLFEKLSEPYPYVACLVADGDRMGRAIERLASAPAHRAFSERLAGFAGDARRVIEQAHRGVLVYAGGDDVLAFLPLPEALACAEALRTEFARVMAAACPSLPPDERPTLSVGVGVGHVMESLGDLLALGRAAEREAKRDRDALAVLVEKRSGSRRAWRAGWSRDPVALLTGSAELLRERLPSRKVYEIASTLARLPEPGAVAPGGDGDRWARLLTREVGRTLSRVEGEALSAADAGLTLVEDAGYAAVHEAVHAWVQRLLIAHTFARAIPRARTRSAEAAA